MVINSSPVDDSTVRPPGFHFPDANGHYWTVSGQDRVTVAHVERNWGLADNERCVCGDIQTMSHIVNSCRLTKLDDGLQRLHAADKIICGWLADVIRHIEAYDTYIWAGSNHSWMPINLRTYYRLLSWDVTMMKCVWTSHEPVCETTYAILVAALACHAF